MKKVWIKAIILMMVLLTVLSMNGCGETDTESSYQPAPGGGISFDQSGDGVLMVEHIEGDKYEIKCEGECGDIIINSTPQIEEEIFISACDIDSDEDYAPEIDGVCESGFWWCPTAGLCKPNQ